MGQITAINRLLKKPQLEGLIASLAQRFRALTELDAIPTCRKAEAQEKPPKSAGTACPLPSFPRRLKPKRRSLAEAVSPSRVSRQVITLVALNATRRPIWARCLGVIALPFSLSWTRPNPNPLVFSGEKGSDLAFGQQRAEATTQFPRFHPFGPPRFRLPLRPSPHSA